MFDSTEAHTKNVDVDVHWIIGLSEKHWSRFQTNLVRKRKYKFYLRSEKCWRRFSAIYGIKVEADFRTSNENRRRISTPSQTVKYQRLSNKIVDTILMQNFINISEENRSSFEIYHTLDNNPLSVATGTKVDTVRSRLFDSWLCCPGCEIHTCNTEQKLTQMWST